MAYFGGEKAISDRKKTELITIATIGAIILGVVVLYFAAVQPLLASLVGARLEQPSAVAPGNPVSVLVPTQQIWPGTRLTPELFTIEQRPPIPGMADRTIRELKDINGTYAATMIAPGGPLLFEHVTVVEPANAITSRIPKGFRAVAIPVNAESGVEGWVRPGVRVDVVWSTVYRTRPIVTIIVPNALVLSAERSTQMAPTANDPKANVVPTHITLMVPIKDAQKIQLAKKAKGSLSLSLRGEGDNEQVGGETVSVDRMLKAKDMLSVADVEGTIKFDGKEFIFRENQLVEAPKGLDKGKQ